MSLCATDVARFNLCQPAPYLTLLPQLASVDLLKLSIQCSNLAAHQHLSRCHTPVFVPYLDRSCPLCSQPLDPLAPVGNLLHAVFHCPHLHHHSLHLQTILAQELHEFCLSLHNLYEQSILLLTLASPPDLTVKDRTTSSPRDTRCR